MTLHPNQLKGAPGYRHYSSIEAAMNAAIAWRNSTGRNYGLVQIGGDEIAIRAHRPDSNLKFMWSTRYA